MLNLQGGYINFTFNNKLFILMTITNYTGRTLVFAPFTGVSLDGHIMLFTGDVQRNWLEVIK